MNDERLGTERIAWAAIDESSRQLIRVSEDGLARFGKIVSAMPELLRKLCDAPGAPRREHTSIPMKPGIYLFTEADVPIYVGQTRKLRERLRNHTIPSAMQEQASFAFLLAKKEARESGLSFEGTRKATASDPGFIEIFSRAKRRVADMEVRFIEVDEPDLRTVFEVYASLALGTGEFNSFETH